MIAYLEDGAPKVETHEGKVAIWVSDEGEPHGLLLKPAAAYDTAFKALGAVARLSDTMMIRPDGVSFDGGFVGDDMEEAFRMVLTVQGTPLALELSPSHVDDLIDGLRHLRRWVDQKRT